MRKILILSIMVIIVIMLCNMALFACNEAPIVEEEYTLTEEVQSYLTQSRKLPLTEEEIMLIKQLHYDHVSNSWPIEKIKIVYYLGKYDGLYIARVSPERGFATIWPNINYNKVVVDGHFVALDRNIMVYSEEYLDYLYDGGHCDYLGAAYLYNEKLSECIKDIYTSYRAVVDRGVIYEV